MLCRLSVGLLASALAIAPLPTKAQDGTAEDLGDVMNISLKDVVKPTIGFQGALQGAGLGAALSRDKGRWVGVPVGAATGALVGCQVDGG